MGERWLKQVIASGVSMLVLLRLRNSPPEDAIQGTLQVWFNVITYRKRWSEQEDRARFEAAFMRLGQTCEQFPSPKQLLDAMPARKVIALPEPERTPEQIEKSVKQIQQIKAMLEGAIQCTRKAVNS